MQYWLAPANRVFFAHLCGSVFRNMLTTQVSENDT